MEVGVRVDAENPITGELTHTASAYTTFVALDENGRPTTVPPIRPETPTEIRRYSAAQARRASRIELAETIKANLSKSKDRIPRISPVAEGASALASRRIATPD